MNFQRVSEYYHQLLPPIAAPAAQVSSARSPEARAPALATQVEAFKGEQCKHGILPQCLAVLDVLSSV